ncbi:MAG TPA: DUF433 domain-containing protein [Phototrophicaceae bacterium]|nr:DUF433 domain-containing protein [Phototrophicaceae bacterium]
MRQFDRITFDVTINSGQASIRDTGITVSEIVQKLVHEKTTAEVLAEYPGLEAEDVEEALAYAVKDLMDAVAAWRHETHRPLTYVTGYSEFVQRGLGTEEQRKIYLNIVAQKSQEVRDLADLPNLWMRIHYGNPSIDWEQFSLSQFIERSLYQLQPFVTIQTIISTDGLQLKANYEITTAVYLLVNNWYLTKLKPGSAMKICEENDKEIWISIFRESENKEPPLREAEIYNWELSPFTLARQIIQRHNLDFQVIPSDEGLTFKFRLPIWKDDSE